MIEKQFCKICKQRIVKPHMLDSFLKKPKIYEFEDGYYCEPCSKVKVGGARK